MRIVEFAVKRWQFTVLLFLMFTASASRAGSTIPRAEDPSFPVPIFTVVAVYPGADAGDMEQLVTEPIEKRAVRARRMSRSSSTLAAATGSR